MWSHYGSLVVLYCMVYVALWNERPEWMSYCCCYVCFAFYINMDCFITMLLCFCVLFHFRLFPKRWENGQCRDKEGKRIGKCAQYIDGTGEGACAHDEENPTTMNKGKRDRLNILQMFYMNWIPIRCKDNAQFPFLIKQNSCIKTPVLLEKKLQKRANSTNIFMFE